MHDVIVVGLGPAGLAARARLTAASKSVLSIDSGVADASRLDLLRGLGGAGLYSDGKFSFRPSASKLWEVEPTHLLRRAEEWFLAIYAANGGKEPNAPLVTNPLPNQKVYASHYLSVDARREMIQRLFAESDEPCEFETTVTGIRQDGKAVNVLFGDGRVVTARSIILAAGRLGTIQFSSQFESVFRRLEFGVRLQAPNSKFPLFASEQLDTKVIRELESGVSWRTFCVCRNGVVETGRWASGAVLSGRSDCPATGLSNCGILVRIEDHETMSRLGLDSIVDRVLGFNRSFDIEYESADRVWRLQRTFGDTAAELIGEAITDFLCITEVANTDEWRIMGPCLEGIGHYPILNSSLEYQLSPSGAPKVLVAGDGGGLFRGLTAALVSGAFCAERIIDSGR